MAPAAEREDADIDVELRSDGRKIVCWSAITGMKERPTLVFDYVRHWFGRIRVVRSADGYPEITNVEAVARLDNVALCIRNLEIAAVTRIFERRSGAESFPPFSRSGP